MDEDKKTPDEEWADALKINFTPPPVPGSTPPPIPEEEVNMEPQQPDQPEENNPDFYRFKEEMPGPEEPVEPMPSTYLIWSILSTVFCCFIPGIVAIIFSSQVSSKYYGGDIEGARKASRTAQIWIIVSVVLGILAATLYVPFMIFAS